MASIVFHTIRIENFLSVGSEPLEVSLDGSPTTLISGENGSGKSCIMDGLTFGLFGKPYRGINKASVVNSVNQRQTSVEIVLSKGQDVYLIRRAIKPTKFEIYCNDELLTQDGASKDYQKRLETILGFEYKAFCQTSLIGSSDYVPFMRLTSQARRQLIETLLDISVFSEMNKLLKQQINDWKDRQRQLSEDLRLKQAQYDNEYKWVGSHNEKIAQQKADKQTEIDQLEQRRESIKASLSTLNNQIGSQSVDSLSNHINNLLNDLHTHEHHLGQYSAAVKQAKSQIQFFQANEYCPSCEQLITETVSKDAVGRYAKKGQEAAIGLKKIEQKRDDIQQQVDQAREDIKTLRDHLSQYQQLEQTLTTIDEKINEKVTERDNITTRSVSEQELERLGGEIRQLNDQLRTGADEQEVYNLAQGMLKDTGIKASIINQYLPVLNAKVNDYLQLLNFPVKFELDSEFNENLQSRYRNEFTYANFSMGERQRLDVSLLFAWRDVAQMKNSVNTNILFLDETMDSHADAEGTEAILSIIYEICKNQNVFIVSHKTLLEDKLDRHIQIGKVNGFTKVIDGAAD